MMGVSARTSQSHTDGPGGFEASQVDGEVAPDDRRNRDRDHDRSALRALRTTRALPARRMGGRRRHQSSRELLVARPARARRLAADRVHLERPCRLRRRHRLRPARVGAPAVRGDRGRHGLVRRRPVDAHARPRRLLRPDRRVRQHGRTGGPGALRDGSRGQQRARTPPRAAPGARAGLGRRARAVPARGRGQPRRVAPPGGLPGPPPPPERPRGRGPGGGGAVVCVRGRSVGRHAPPGSSRSQNVRTGSAAGDGSCDLDGRERHVVRPRRGSAGGRALRPTRPRPFVEVAECAHRERCGRPFVRPRRT